MLPAFGNDQQGFFAVIEFFLFDGRRALPAAVHDDLRAAVSVRQHVVARAVRITDDFFHKVKHARPPRFIVYHIHGYFKARAQISFSRLRFSGAFAILKAWNRK